MATPVQPIQEQPTPSIPPVYPSSPQPTPPAAPNISIGAGQPTPPPTNWAESTIKQFIQPQSTDASKDSTTTTVTTRVASTKKS